MLDSAVACPSHRRNLLRPVASVEQQQRLACSRGETRERARQIGMQAPDLIITCLGVGALKRGQYHALPAPQIVVGGMAGDLVEPGDRAARSPAPLPAAQ